LTKVLGQQPAHAVALVNLGIVHLDQGRLDDAMRRFGAAWRLRPEAFGRIANALCSSSCGALWLDAATLKRALSAAA
jgi:cytochrome c-type biogenesis protein CcmH/NrfG